MDSSKKRLLANINLYFMLKSHTNRFHVSICLFNNRSQMRSKRGKNKKVEHKVMAECVTDNHTTF